MKEIKRIDYKKNAKFLPDFEIVDLQLFFSTRLKSLLETDNRLNFWTIIYIINGQGRHNIDFVEFKYTSGDIIFVQKNQVHKFEVNHDVKGYIMHINEPFLYNLNQYENDLFLELIDQSYGSPIINVDSNESSTNRRLLELLYTECNRKYK